MQTVNEPVPVPGSVPFVEAAGGQQFACLRTAGGEIHCIGRNNRGQLGVGEGVQQSGVPLRVAGGRRYRQVLVAAWASYACGLLDAPGTPEDRTLECWCALRGCGCGDGPAAARRCSCCRCRRCLLPLPTTRSGRCHRCTVGAAAAAAVAANRPSLAACAVPAATLPWPHLCCAQGPEQLCVRRRHAAHRQPHAPALQAGAGLGAGRHHRRRALPHYYVALRCCFAAALRPLAHAPLPSCPRAPLHPHADAGTRLMRPALVHGWHTWLHTPATAAPSPPVNPQASCAASRWAAAATSCALASTFGRSWGGATTARRRTRLSTTWRPWRPPIRASPGSSWPAPTGSPAPWTRGARPTAGARVRGGVQGWAAEAGSRGRGSPRLRGWCRLAALAACSAAPGIPAAARLRHPRRAHACHRRATPWPCAAARVSAGAATAMRARALTGGSMWRTTQLCWCPPPPCPATASARWAWAGRT